MGSNKINKENLDEVLHHKKKEENSKEINESLKDFESVKKKVQKTDHFENRMFIKENLREIIPSEKKEPKSHPYHEAPHNPNKGKHHIIHVHISHAQILLIVLGIILMGIIGYKVYPLIIENYGFYGLSSQDNSIQDFSETPMEYSIENNVIIESENNTENNDEIIDYRKINPEEVDLLIEEVILSNKKVKSIGIKIKNNGTPFKPIIIIEIYDSPYDEEFLSMKEIEAGEDITGERNFIIDLNMDNTFSSEEQERKIEIKVIDPITGDIIKSESKTNLFI